MDKRTCKVCGVEKDILDFPTTGKSNKKIYYSHKCRICYNTERSKDVMSKYLYKKVQNWSGDLFDYILEIDDKQKLFTSDELIFVYKWLKQVDKLGTGV